MQVILSSGFLPGLVAVALFFLLGRGVQGHKGGSGVGFREADSFDAPAGGKRYSRSSAGGKAGWSTDGGHNGHNATAPGLDDVKRDSTVTDILHSLLSKYDYRIRPFYPDTPVFVTVRFETFQIVDVFEGRGELSSIVLVQQSWVDPRLEFEDEEYSEGAERVQYITINHENTRELWVPDLFFANEKKPQQNPDSTSTPATNDALLVFRNGTVLRSARVAVGTHCEFSYEQFPFDSHVCRLSIGSHAHRTTDVNYGWDEAFVVDVEGLGKREQREKFFASNSHGGRFVVTAVDLNEDVQQLNYGNLSRLNFSVTLQRTWRPFIVRFYLPMVLFVFVSLGSLFYGDTYRIALIVNLVNLAFVNIFVALRSSSSSTSFDSPPTTHCFTAYDSYVILCLSYIAIVLAVTFYKLVRTQTSSGVYHRGGNTVPLQQPNASLSGTSSSGAFRGPSFPETIVLRQNSRRRMTDQDIFNPVNTSSEMPDSTRREEDNNGASSSAVMMSDDEREQIYRTTSYPITGSGTVKWVWRRTRKFAGWLWDNFRWILIGSFLLTDFVYFRVHAVQYS